ncbi:hypothetical protein GGS23DRAFT_323732 [Durotheca rogersii]|uniref:uncharacterized protein n=1 Tax=Durotheca rogersii TaxID=419775 RepID=UPI00221F2016|nr:uncharacterized protein GGS23DRAFT_323732 [Durotheca rogersii]KAI5859348.1 hypothetical protein GGS23DRAFT_323732 [Durotheca rogersii]
MDTINIISFMLHIPDRSLGRGTEMYHHPSLVYDEKEMGALGLPRNHKGGNILLFVRFLCRGGQNLFSPDRGVLGNKGHFLAEGGNLLAADFGVGCGMGSRGSWREGSERKRGRENGSELPAGPNFLPLGPLLFLRACFFLACTIITMLRVWQKRKLYTSIDRAYKTFPSPFHLSFRHARAHTRTYGGEEESQPSQ